MGDMSYIRTGDLASPYYKIAGILIGIYFTGVFFYLLFNAVIPLTTSGGWRRIADVIAVGFYLLGIVPLVVAHVAMIFGMLNPSLLM